MTLGRGQVGLRGGRADAPHGWYDWKLQEAGEILYRERKAYRLRNATNCARNSSCFSGSIRPKRSTGKSRMRCIWASVIARYNGAIKR